MLQRKSMEHLKQWKLREKKVALCIVGARQIGKTTLVREFAKECYQNFLEINFIVTPSAKQLFAGDLNADTLCENLTAFARKPLTVGKTLILVDEVQECPAARTAIKFLVEDGRFDYIETGSLLGVNYQQVTSYPVGFEEIYHMYPMDLEEFLTANGVQQDTLKYLQDCYEQQLPVSESIHATLLKLFKLYVIVGGMPQVVQNYVDTHDIGRVVEIQKNILTQYRLDITKYAGRNGKVKIGRIFDTLPAQLNSKNRRFKLSVVAADGRMNRYEDSFQWLADAGVALPCYNVSEPQLPLSLNTKHNLFKLYLNDTGLLCSSCMDNVQLSILQGDLEINMGSILENIFAQQLQYNGYSLHYFDSKKHGEVDFVVENKGNIDLLEIKSGKDYHRHRALDNVAAVEGWYFGRKIVFAPGNVEVNGDVLYLPWYMVMFYRDAVIRKSQVYQIT